MQFVPRYSALILLVPALASCAVPDISFSSNATVAADGGEAGAGDPSPLGDPGLSVDGDGGAPGTGAGAPDAEGDVTAERGPEAGAAPVKDGGAEGCPIGVPSGAAACCATVPCVAPNANKCLGACAKCEEQCAGRGLTCCLAPNGSFRSCATSPAACASAMGGMGDGMGDMGPGGMGPGAKGGGH